MVTHNNTRPAEPSAAELAKQKEAEAAKAAPEKAATVAAKADGLKVAVNLIVQTGKDGKPEDVLPGTTFYPAAVDLAFLTKHEAIRDATDAERVMHEHVAKLQAAAAADADEALG